MDTQKLRQRILDLAIRGKLVPQDPNDEPASVLLKRIRAEKERLIAEGKIKRPKAKKSTDKSHYQQFTPPFDIPGSWKWVRMEDICFAITDGDHQAPPKANDGIPFLVISDIITGIIKFDKCRYVPYEYYSNLETNRKPSKGDILFTVTGSYGKSVIVETDKPFCFQRHIGLIKPILISKYLNIVLCSEYLEKECDAKATGTAQKTVGLESLRNFFIPIPPLEEQNRIIKLINSFEDLLQILESERSNLDVDIKLAKSKILDLAMQGKLVPQDPADEPAAEMLRHINPKAKIITDNPHYQQLPDNWVLTKLGDVVKVINGKSQKEVENPSGAYPIYGSGGVIGKADAYSCLSGSTIIGRKGTINNPQFIETNFWNVDTAFGMKPCEAVNDLYFYYFCKSFDFTSLDKSSTLPSLTKTAIEGILMPIPPLEEQRRIILKIKEYDELFRNIFTQIGQK